MQTIVKPLISNQQIPYIWSKGGGKAEKGRENQTKEKC